MRMCACVYVCVCTCVCERVSVCTYMCACMHGCVHTCEYESCERQHGNETAHLPSCLWSEEDAAAISSLSDSSELPKLGVEGNSGLLRFRSELWGVEYSASPIGCGRGGSGAGRCAGDGDSSDVEEIMEEIIVVHARVEGDKLCAEMVERLGEGGWWCQGGRVAMTGLGEGGGSPLSLLALH